jgi:hypothetical protein
VALGFVSVADHFTGAVLHKTRIAGEFQALESAEMQSILLASLKSDLRARESHAEHGQKDPDKKAVI